MIAPFLSLFGVGPSAKARNMLLQAKATVSQLKDTLRSNILGFWLPRTIDRRYGGYIINFDAFGRPTAHPTKGAITQSRHLWLFSRAYRAGYGDKELLDAAEHGYRFLRAKLWDERYAGFYWEVSPGGNKIIRGKKHLVAQFYGLFAISEYGLASGRREAVEFASRFFQFLDEKTHDQQNGGYIEAFERDWSPARPRQEHYMGVVPSYKLLNTQMHILEALSTFYRATGLPLAAERVKELITIQSTAVVRHGLGTLVPLYTHDWRQVVSNNTRVSYGHDLENISLLVDACDAVRIPVYPLLEFFRHSFRYSMRYGWDDDRGGFFESGRIGTAADRRDKVWWVQAEALWSALLMYKLTTDPYYLNVYLRTWDFTKKWQIDWNNGEWWERVTAKGRTRGGDKAHLWKAGYHQGRAMIECVDILTSMK